jgi:F0F1-type ATP synthase membrane subunit b/b'
MTESSRDLREGKTSISLVFASARVKLILVLMLGVFNTISVSASPQRAVDWQDSNRWSVAHGSVPRPEDSSQGEYASLKHSSSVRLLAHLLGLSPEITFHLCWDFNFLLMLALIFCKGGPLLKAALQARSRSIRQAIDEAQRLSEDARKRLAEIEKRWAQLDSKIAAVRAVAEVEVKNEEQTLMAKTAEDIRRILQYSQFEIDKAKQCVRQDLMVFAAGLAVSLARQSIRVDERTDREFVKGLAEGIGKPTVLNSRISL